MSDVLTTDPGSIEAEAEKTARALYVRKFVLSQRAKLSAEKTYNEIKPKIEDLLENFSAELFYTCSDVDAREAPVVEGETYRIAIGSQDRGAVYASPMDAMSDRTLTLKQLVACVSFDKEQIEAAVKVKLITQEQADALAIDKKTITFPKVTLVKK